MHRIKFIFTAVFLLYMISTSVAFASEGGHVYAWDNLAYRTINILLFLALCYKFFGKKIKEALGNRTKGISSEIDSLKSSKVSSEERLSEVNKRIAHLDQECEKILRSYQEQGEKLKAEIIAQANKTAEQIKEQAKTSAENEVAQAITLLRNQMADEIIHAAEVIIEQKLTASQQEKLIDESLSKVVLN